jgi:DNA helicase-2/ATP-dependent DNA helicase PcrA
MMATSPILSSKQFRYNASARTFVADARTFDNPAEVFGDSLRVRMPSGRLLRFYPSQTPGRYQTTVDGAKVFIQVTNLPEAPVPRPLTDAEVNPPKVSAADLFDGKEPPAPAVTGEHVVVVARAGTGKTTTAVSGLRHIRGENPGIIPSAQQLAIWKALEASRDARFIGFIAYNVSIANELKARVPRGVDAKTFHSLGLSAVKKAFGNVQVHENRTEEYIEELTGKDIRALRKAQPDFVNAVVKLASLCKADLTDVADRSAVMKLADHYEVDLEEVNLTELMELLPRVLERAKDVAKGMAIDYDDMVWLPVALGLNVFRYDLLLVDEAQDLNRCRQALAQKAGRRLILIGDPKQAIYGFAGADSAAMPRMTAILRKSDRGCVELPLTVTRRCGKAIVAEAQKLVPDFSAHESNPAGAVYAAKLPTDSSRPEKDYRGHVQDGDMVICRTNAPLISAAFSFIREKRKVTVLGRDIGKGLVKQINKLMKDWTAPAEAETAKDRARAEMSAFNDRLGAWYRAEVDKENERKHPRESKLVGLSDRRDCLETIAEECESTAEMIDYIETLFSETAGSGIRLSSIHKSKGLEADRVFLLEPKGATVPHPMAKSKHAIEQEYNLRYVAITRAIQALYFVSETGPAKPEAV